jgi:hypothetical protein
MDFPSFIVDVDCRVNWKPGDLVRIKHDIGLLPWLLGESMAGHTDIFPKNLFWYHLLTALAYKTL